jgi:hypothetical protein
MLNPRARENTPFYRARYFHQGPGSRFVYLLEAFCFEPDRFREKTPNAGRDVSPVGRK